MLNSAIARTDKCRNFIRPYLMKLCCRVLMKICEAILKFINVSGGSKIEKQIYSQLTYDYLFKFITNKNRDKVLKFVAKTILLK